jgi:hypothetical protein
MAAMRMTREAYAREVWKAIEAVCEGEETVACPHEDCREKLKILIASVQTGATIVCPSHGLIYRE